MFTVYNIYSTNMLQNFSKVTAVHLVQSGMHVQESFASFNTLSCTALTSDRGWLDIWLHPAVQLHQWLPHMYSLNRCLGSLA